MNTLREFRIALVLITLLAGAAAILGVVAPDEKIALIGRRS